MIYIHPTAIVEQGCEMGEGTKIWHFSHIMPTADWEPTAT